MMLTGCRKLVGCKISVQNSVVFLHEETKLSAKEIRVIIPFTISSERMEYLRMNFPKKV